MMAAILNSSMGWILLSQWIQPSLFSLSNSLTLCQDLVPTIGKLIEPDSNSFILTQLDDGSHLEFCWVGFRHNVFFSEIHSKTLSLSSLILTQTNSFWLTLIHSHTTSMMAAILNCANFCIQPFCTKKTSLVHSDSIWWWQPSWILPCWIQTLPSWIETLFYLLSDLLKNTLSPLWLWFKLIQSDSNSFILT